MAITPIRSPWKGTMTPRERFNRQMHFKSFDRSFNMEFGYWAENYKYWDIFTQNGIENEAQANEFFGFDPIKHVYGIVWMDPPFPEKEIGRKGNRIIIQDANGVTAEVPESGASSIPHYTDSAIKTPEDWKRVKEERFRTDSPRRKLDVDHLMAIHPTDRTYPLGVGCGSMVGRIRDMLTFEGICYAWADYPDMLEDMVETCCIMVEHILDQVLGKIDFDFGCGWEDICFNHGPILPPSFFIDVVAPRYKRIFKKLQAHGIDLWYTDCDGDVRKILDIFLDSGINCLFPYEVNSCAHPGELLDQYPNLRIMGGVDKMQLRAGPQATKKYLESLVPYVKRGGFIPFCDHLCPPDVTPSNYLYYLDMKRELFG